MEVHCSAVAVASQMRSKVVPEVSLLSLCAVQSLSLPTLSLACFAADLIRLSPVPLCSAAPPQSFL